MTVELAGQDTTFEEQLVMVWVSVIRTVDSDCTAAVVTAAVVTGALDTTAEPVGT